MTDLFDVITIKTPFKLGRITFGPSLKRGEFDSHLVDAAFTFRWEDKFYMTYIGWDGIGYRTGLASSDDLVLWHREGLIIDRGPAGSFTQNNVALTWIIRDNELYGDSNLKLVDGSMLGTYHAYPEAGYEAGPACIGLCRSNNLKDWELEEPCLRSDDPDAGEWEKGGLYKSCIVEHEGSYYMFYNAKGSDGWPWREQTGLVVSTDLKSWKRAFDHPIIANGPAGSIDEIFASDPCVVRHQGKWIMFYYTLSADGHARDSAAFSDDLLHWEKLGEALTNPGGPGQVDSEHAHKPAVITKDGILYHYYCAVSPATPGSTGEITHNEHRGIALATSRALA